MNKNCCTRILFLIVFISASLCITAQTSLKDETRFPYGTSTGGFIQDWLLLADFQIKQTKVIIPIFFKKMVVKQELNPNLE